VAGRHAGAKIVTINEHFTEAKTNEALRVLILRRFAGWLDDVLAKEKPMEGVAKELLAELYDEKESGAVGPGAGASDLHSTWSAMTALTQEVKLQGRAFKQLSEKMAPFTGLEAMVDKLLEAHRKTLSDVRRIAEEGRTDRTERETELKRAARQRARHELIGVITELRDSLTIGLRSAVESQRKMEEHPKRRRLKEFFIHRSTDHRHMLEIVGALKKGYQLGLDRIDETLQPLGVTEIVCDGKPFDPRVMKAADIEETGEVPDGTVLEVYRTGYMIDAEVLQPAQVKVARTSRKE
jgi:molecular chaperone GrpE